VQTPECVLFPACLLHTLHMTGNTDIPIAISPIHPSKSQPEHSHSHHPFIGVTGPPTTLNQNSQPSPQLVFDSFFFSSFFFFLSKGLTSRSSCFEDTPSSRAGKNSAGETGGYHI
jgi:hypothetical protein